MFFVSLMVASLMKGKMEPASKAVSRMKCGLVEFSSSTKLGTARKEAAVQLTTMIKHL